MACRLDFVHGAIWSGPWVAKLPPFAGPSASALYAAQGAGMGCCKMPVHWTPCAVGSMCWPWGLLCMWSSQGQHRVCSACGMQAEPSATSGTRGLGCGLHVTLLVCLPCCLQCVEALQPFLGQIFFLVPSRGKGEWIHQEAQLYPPAAQVPGLCCSFPGLRDRPHAGASLVAGGCRLVWALLGLGA